MKTYIDQQLKKIEEQNKKKQAELESGMRRLGGGRGSEASGMGRGGSRASGMGGQGRGRGGG